MSKQMIKRKDGSYSQRGLWDNIRANKGSGKKPTKQMLKQEKKIKSKYGLGGEMDNTAVQYPPLQSPTTSMQALASNSLGAPVETPAPQEEQPQSAFRKGGTKNKKSEIMKTMYKKAGKAPKKMRESFLEESKEIHFGNPPKGKKKFAMGGPGDPPTADAASTNTTQGQPVTTGAKGAMAAAPDKYAKAKSKMSPEELDYFETLSDRKKGKLVKNNVKDAYEHSNELKEINQEKETKAASGKKNFFERQKERRDDRQAFQLEKIKAGQAQGEGFKNIAEGAGTLVEKGSEAVQGLYRLDKQQSNQQEERMGGKRSYMGGGKSMKPGGGGRFAAMVSELKGKGKSAEQAAGIAASAGRKKYGKNKFQAMAAAGKARMGGKKC